MPERESTPDEGVAAVAQHGNLMEEVEGKGARELLKAGLKAEVREPLAK